MPEGHMSTLLNIRPSEAVRSEPILSEAFAPPRPPRSRARWTREPLLHFLVLGGLVFAVDQIMVSRTDDPHTIVVGADVDSEAMETFEAARGRKPNPEELQALHAVWLDNEVLY